MARPYFCWKGLLVALLVGLSGCGGGGDDSGDFVSAANVALNASPRTIDTGDRMRIMVAIGDVHKDGIILKILYPSGLSYVPESAALTVDDNDLQEDPAVNQAAGPRASAGTYLVFFLANDLFGKGNRGTLTFELVGTETVQSGAIAVDADVDDPAKPNPGEFDIENPEFDPQDSVEIAVN